ncbi:hypothetical protein SAMN05216318_1413 [Nitrosomonas eutropha]|nr:MAG: hypothetical protein UZ02_AOB001000591 [Nitrosomonas europaea]SEJ28738.1 hypothetical protein SAMN05216318_1413 [Nitrosomonas eutropha]
MTHFILTRNGYESLISVFGKVPSPLWVNSGVLSESELAQLRSQGIDVTSFTNPIVRSNESEFEDALHTIHEHHPGLPIWVEHGL